MATKIIVATIQNLESEFKKIGYGTAVSSEDPYYSAAQSIITFYIKEVQRDQRRPFLEGLSSKLSKFGADYDSPSNAKSIYGSSIGGIKFQNSKIKIICKYHPKAKEIPLKPSHIDPPIVDHWLPPETIIKNVETYLKSKKFYDTPFGKQVRQFMEESLNSRSDEIKVEGDRDQFLIPAEFIEVLTAIRMVTKLRRNDTKLLKDLCTSPQKAGIGPFRKNSPLYIRIPKESNFKLIDFEVSFIKNDYKNTFKVSTKSKIKSPGTNTLKFDQMFDGVKDVSFWFRNLSSNVKKRQFGPATVAYSALRFYSQGAEARAKQKVKKNFIGAPRPAKPAEKYAGKIKVGFPIDAVGNLLTKGLDTINLAEVIINRSIISGKKTNRKPTPDEIKSFGIVCRMITRNISNLNTKEDITHLFPSDKIYKKHVRIAADLISMNNQEGGKGSSSKPAQPTMINLGKYCEKILEWASKRTSQTKHNYFRMFYQKALQEKEVIYAVGVSRVVGRKENKETYVKFQFRSVNNWLKEYETWIGLRKKDGDALGLDL